MFTSVVSLGKYGSFHTNSIIGRPYYLTFEVLERSEQKDGRELRILRASEIHAETILEEAEPDLGEEASASTPSAGHFDEYGLPSTTEKSNVNIIDNTENQKLTYSEIEALKSEPLTNPKDLIALIRANHSQIDQKTAFSLAKYNLRKHKKYMRRFTVLPLDVATLTDWMMNEKDFTKVMEMRNESLGLIGSWANVFASPEVSPDDEPRCRYLVVDDTSGLVTAAIAERMGLLHHQKPISEGQRTTQQQPAEARPPSDATQEAPQTQTEPPPKRPRYEHPPATSNTITLVHANQQPNLSLLRYFGFDPTQKPAAHDPTPHPLYTHLNTLTWLQLLDPASDATYAQEPEVLPTDELAKMKANHRSDYFRKRRRWTRTQQIVNSARDGGFNALIIASATNPVSICKHLVPLLAGGAQVVVYNHHIEPLMELCDVYATARRAAYLQWRNKRMQAKEDEEEYVKVETADVENEGEGGFRTQASKEDEEEAAQFPVDPTLLLTPTVHHSVARPWQVLPGRTHPMMMGKGGAEGGYVMVSTRVIPIEGVAVQARGRQGKNRKKKTDEQQSGEKRQKLSAQPEEDVRTKEEDEEDRVKLEELDEMDEGHDGIEDAIVS